MKKRLLFIFAGLLQLVCAQVRILEIDVFVTDASDDFIGLTEISTTGLKVNTFARVKGRVTPGDGLGGDYLWDGTAWNAVPSSSSGASAADVAAAVAAESTRAQAAEAANAASVQAEQTRAQAAEAANAAAIAAETARAMAAEDLLAMSGTLPEFYDDFERADTGGGANPLPDVASGLISDPPVGSPYTYRFAAATGDSHNLRIEDGALVSDPVGPAWYILQTLENDCYNMGVEWRTKATDGSDPYSLTNSVAQVVMAIKPNDAWIGPLIHIVVTEAAWNITVGVNVSDLTNNLLASGGYQFGRLTEDKFRSNTAQVEIYDGDKMRLYINGVLKADVQHSLIADNAGRYLYWEAVPQDEPNGQIVMMDRIWANDPRAKLASIGRSVQGYSPRLDALAEGVISGSPIYTFNESSDTGSNNQFQRAGRPPLSLRNTFSAPVGNVGTTTTNLSVVGAGLHQLSEPGDSIRYEYFGTFAANSNSKTIEWKHAGMDGFAVARSTNGGSWKMVIIVSKTILKNYEAVGFFSDDAGNASFFDDSSLSNATFSNISLKATGVADNDIILRQAKQFWAK